MTRSESWYFNTFCVQVETADYSGYRSNYEKDSSPCGSLRNRLLINVIQNSFGVLDLVLFFLRISLCNRPPAVTVQELKTPARTHVPEVVFPRSRIPRFTATRIKCYRVKCFPRRGLITTGSNFSIFMEMQQGLRESRVPTHFRRSGCCITSCNFLH